MRTTNKLFKEQVQKDILNGLLDEQELKNGYDIETTEESLVPSQLSIVVNEFNSWYGEYEQKRISNKYEAFQDWLMGLPSCLNIDFSHHDISKTLEKWYTNAGMIYKEREGHEETDWYLHLITREFSTLCKKHNISF